LRDGETVGRLERDEVTEENILRRMSAATAHSERSRVDAALGTGEVVLTTRGIQLVRYAPTVELSIQAGEIVGLAGLDGAGQAELISTLAGIRAPLGGTTIAPSGPVTDLATAEAAGIAYVSGDRKREGIFPNLSILENFGLALHGRFAGPGGLLDRKAIGRAFQREVERLAIKFGREEDQITTLSGGNQQKVLIARAFALSPKVILLNDPARGVDIGTKQVLWQQLREFADAGGAVVYLSTEIEEFFNFIGQSCLTTLLWGIKLPLA